MAITTKIDSKKTIFAKISFSILLILLFSTFVRWAFANGHNTYCYRDTCSAPQGTPYVNIAINACKNPPSDQYQCPQGGDDIDDDYDAAYNNSETVQTWEVGSGTSGEVYNVMCYDDSVNESYPPKSFKLSCTDENVYISDVNQYPGALSFEAGNLQNSNDGGDSYHIYIEDIRCDYDYIVTQGNSSSINPGDPCSSDSEVPWSS